MQLLQPVLVGLAAASGFDAGKLGVSEWTKLYRGPLLLLIGRIRVLQDRYPERHRSSISRCLSHFAASNTFWISVSNIVPMLSSSAAPLDTSARAASRAHAGQGPPATSAIARRRTPVIGIPVEETVHVRIRQLMKRSTGGEAIVQHKTRVIDIDLRSYFTTSHDRCSK